MLHQIGLLPVVGQMENEEICSWWSLVIWVLARIVIYILRNIHKMHMIFDPRQDNGWVPGLFILRFLRQRVKIVKFLLILLVLEPDSWVGQDQRILTLLLHLIIGVILLHPLVAAKLVALLGSASLLEASSLLLLFILSEPHF